MTKGPAKGKNHKKRTRLGFGLLTVQPSESDQCRWEVAVLELFNPPELAEGMASFEKRFISITS